MTTHHDPLGYTEALELAEQAPRDGMGAGYLVYRLAADFHALCCLCGPEQARQELAEIILSEFTRGDKNVRRP